MRVVVLGAGAVGGLVGARLHQHGHEVMLVARGEHGAAMRTRGLQVESPAGSVRVHPPVVSDVSELELGVEDLVLVATKSQHTPDALDALGAVAAAETPVACLQNGVENERLALRRFANVYAVCVICPATHLEPGVVVAHRDDPTGILDLGRYPDGVDQLAQQLVDVFSTSAFLSEARPDIMRWKYAKLLVNLGNALEVICGPGRRGGVVSRRAREEGAACLAAAGVEFASDAEDQARRGDAVPRPAGGDSRGGSSWQSLIRRTGNVEADYLNGEIVLLGRQYGVPTPVNEVLQRLANQLARGRGAPGTMTEDDVLQLVP